MTAKLIAALGDEIVSTTQFRSGLKECLSRVREGEVVTVTGRQNEEPVAVVTRRVLAALVNCAQRLKELEAELSDSEALAQDADAMESLHTAASKIRRGEGLSADDVRDRLGRPKKGR